MPARVILEVQGPQRRRLVFDRHDTLVVGRHSQCGLRLLGDRTISRHHCLFEIRPPRVTLWDLGSLNGTLVNGRPCRATRPAGLAEPAAETSAPTPAVELKSGDRVTVGGATLVVTVEGAAPVTCPRCGRVWEQPAEGSATAEGSGGEAAAWCEACREEAAAGPDALRELLRRAALAVAGQDGRLRVPGYVLGEQLGRGAMGVVYRAVREEDGLPVAVKVALPAAAPDGQRRLVLERELATARALRHPNLAQLLDWGQAGELLFFVFEYCSGGSLADLAGSRGGRVSWTVAAPILMDCLAGLEYIHLRGFVHRNLKPGNLLLHQQGASWQGKIGDFGLARSFLRAGLSGVTTSGFGAATYHFMPREQLTSFKYVTPAADVWSLAASFFFALAGRPPRPAPPDRDPAAVVLEADAEPLGRYAPQTPPAVAEVLDRALSADTQQRYPDAMAMRRALLQAVTHSTGEGTVLS